MTSFAEAFGALGPYLLLLAAAALPNEVWRWIAVLATARLNDDSPVFVWVRHVATSLVAGVVAQLLLIPSGPLATAPLWLRFAALVGAALVWRFAGRRMVVAWASGVALLIAGASLFGA